MTKFNSLQVTGQIFQFWSQSVHLWSCDLQIMEFINLAISQSTLRWNAIYLVPGLYSLYIF